jgi:hypothetical protein
MKKLLKEVKGDAEQQDETEATVNVGDKKVTIKVTKNQEESNQGKRQLLCE